MENNTRSTLLSSKNTPKLSKSKKSKIIIAIIILIILLLLNILSKSKNKIENIETASGSSTATKEVNKILNMMSAAANSVRQAESLSPKVESISQKEILEKFNKTGLK